MTTNMLTYFLRALSFSILLFIIILLGGMFVEWYCGYLLFQVHGMAFYFLIALTEGVVITIGAPLIGFASAYNLYVLPPSIRPVGLWVVVVAIIYSGLIQMHTLWVDAHILFQEGGISGVGLILKTCFVAMTSISYSVMVGFIAFIKGSELEVSL